MERSFGARYGCRRPDSTAPIRHRNHTALNAPGGRSSSRTRQILAIGLLAFFFVDTAAAIDQKYCSSQNTGTVARGYETYQSTGLCHDYCLDYAFAVVRGHYCWCANLIPHPSNRENDCNKGCPGIDLEACGNADSGSYGYIEVRNRKPKGTAGADDETVASTVSDPSTSTSPPPLPPPPPPPPATSSIYTSSTSSYISLSSSILSIIVTTVFISPIEKSTTSNSKQASKSSAQSSETSTPTAPWVSIITIDGPPITVTFTPSGWVDPTSVVDPDATSNKSGGFFSDAGRVAGVFTVIALLTIAMIGALFWIMRRRKQKGVPLGTNSSGPDKFGGVIIGAHEKRRSRSMSTLGLAGAGYGLADKQPPIISANSGSSGVNGGLNPAGTPERLVDQRLDPGQVWMRFENDNASRMSVRSLRDDQDYSRRVLRLANPDDD